MRSFIVSLLLLCFCSIVQCLSSTGTRLLVVLEDLKEKDKYSKFWDDLKDRGYQLTHEVPKNDPELFKLGERAYDHLLILPTKLKALGPALTPQKLLQFMKQEGNILLGLSSEVQTPLSLISLLLELDIHLPPERGTVTVDHFHYDRESALEKHDVLYIEPPSEQAPRNIRPDLIDYFQYQDPLVFPHTIAQVLGNDSPLLTPIVYASNRAFTYQPSEELRYASEPWATGEQLKIVSAMQARNSARLTVLGSAEALEDKWFDAKVRHSASNHWDKETKVTANRAFARQLSAWTFQELGVVRVNEINHYLETGEWMKVKGKWERQLVNITRVEAGNLNPKIYRIKNDVTFHISLSEYFVDKYVPFAPPEDDLIQLEVTMLSPFHRLNLNLTSTTPTSSVWTTTFVLPDQHGIFNFRVNYKRPFLTNIDEKRTVTVRHFAHDEWPRSFVITGAYVWILGLWATIGGWLLFVGLWLWSGKPKEEKAGEKKQQ